MNVIAPECYRSTLIDLGSPRKKLCGHQNYPPPRYAYFRACLKKIGAPLHRFFWGPPKGLPPPLEKFLRAPMVTGTAWHPPSPLHIKMVHLQCLYYSNY